MAEALEGHNAPHGHSPSRLWGWWKGHAGPDEALAARPRKPVNWYRDHRLWIMALVLPVAFTANGVRQLIHAQRLTAQLEGIASLLAAMVIVGLVTLYLRRPVDEGWGHSGADGRSR